MSARLIFLFIKKANEDIRELIHDLAYLNAMQPVAQLNATQLPQLCLSLAGKICCFLCEQWSSAKESV